MSEHPFLAGNFAPVPDEITAFDLPVTGKIPDALSGRLLRIGPNPVEPDPQKHHWFLGNGLAHGLRLRDGKAEWYRARFVRDPKVVSHFGFPAVPGPEAAHPLGAGVNTNLLAHGGHTYATVEAGDLPIELSYELETLSRSDFSGTLRGSFSGHPKRDPDTGELWTVAYSPAMSGVEAVVVTPEGRVRRTVEIPTLGYPMLHDCALTEKYLLILDLPVRLDLSVLERGGQFPYWWHPESGARVGLLPREGNAEDIRWCEVEPCYVFHPLNAYDAADGTVVLDVVRHPSMFARDARGPNDDPATLYRWVLDPATGRTQETPLDDRGQEFPRHDERRLGKPYRYGYTATLAFGDAGTGVAPGLLKHDLETGGSAFHQEGPERYFMEPVFVPASDDAGEDEGWVMAYLYDAREDRSDVVILDARDFDGGPVATVHLPRRVPYGFHGNWAPDD